MYTNCALLVYTDRSPWLLTVVMEILLHYVHQPVGFLLPISAAEAVIDSDLKLKIL